MTTKNVPDSLVPTEIQSEPEVSEAISMLLPWGMSTFIEDPVGQEVMVVAAMAGYLPGSDSHSSPRQ